MKKSTFSLLLWALLYFKCSKMLRNALSNKLAKLSILVHDSVRMFLFSFACTEWIIWSGFLLWIE